MTQQDLDLVREVILETLQFNNKITNMLEPDAKWNVIVRDNPPTVEIIHQPAQKHRQPEPKEWEMLTEAFKKSTKFSALIAVLRENQPSQLTDLKSIHVYANDVSVLKQKIKLKFPRGNYLVHVSGEHGLNRFKKVEILVVK